MPLHTTDAYVLRTYALAEADKICIFLTRDMGKVRGVAHGARKMKSRFGSAGENLRRLSFYKEYIPGPAANMCAVYIEHFSAITEQIAVLIGSP